MDAKTAGFIDRMGLALESEGLPRTAGRIFGLLLVSEDCRSLDEIATQLHVSKASVSTNARLLEQRGVLERNSRPSDRRDYYRVQPDLFSHTMAQRLQRWQRLHEAIGDARTKLPIRSRKVLKRLEDYDSAYTFLTQAIREALENWSAAHNDASALAVAR
ncbi:MAG TPA: MarR family transcriptional regulator [Gemmatimonadales bacterium]|nr:MarR family transcriptional regulator [Gemmatimonadales bacterium]